MKTPVNNITDSGILIQVYTEKIENVMRYIRTFITSYREIKMHRAPWKVEIHTVFEGKESYTL